MDGINLLNKTRVMTTCRLDGVVLKPDRPIVTTDWCMMQADPTCYVYTAYSETSVSNGASYQRTSYHFNNVDTYKGLEPLMVGLPSNTSDHAVYNWYTEELTMLKPSQTLAPGYEGHVYAVVTPVLSGQVDWVFLSDTNKYVTHAGLRFGNLQFSAATLSVDVTGVKGETVRVCAAKAADMKVIC